MLPWGHAHGPEPQQLAGPGGWQRGLSAAGRGLAPMLRRYHRARIRSRPGPVLGWYCFDASSWVSALRSPSATSSDARGRRQGAWPSASYASRPAAAACWCAVLEFGAAGLRVRLRYLCSSPATWRASAWGCFRECVRGLKGGQMLEQQAFIAGSVAGIQDASMFDDLFSAFVTQRIERKSPELVRVFVRVRSPELFQSGE